MSEHLDGKFAAVTGGTSGLGLAIAQRFVNEGARVLISGTGSESVTAALEQLGPNAAGLAGDVRDVGFLDQFARLAGDLFGHVDIVVASAGIASFHAVGEIDEEEYARLMDINVKGSFFTVQKMLPLLTHGGSIILLSSASLRGVSSGSLYNASKAAIRSLAMSFADEFGASKSIRVNCLSPGVISTNIQKRMNIPEDEYVAMSSQIVDRIPIRRRGRAEEIGSAALFLASDESSYMTGADLVIDGGWMNTGF